jgi:hypothetical protein
MKKRKSASSVDHPPHYRAHPSGVECIEIAEHLNFCLGNVIKYVWRAGEKGSELEDLRKARWYLEREIARLEKGRPAQTQTVSSSGVIAAALAGEKR